MANTNNKGLFWWVGGLAFLVLGSMALLPRLLGKSTVVGPVTPIPAGGTAPFKTAGVTPAGFDYGVANSQYGRLNNYNFAGLAIEQPTNVMPLGFHLNNVL